MIFYGMFIGISIKERGFCGPMYLENARLSDPTFPRALIVPTCIVNCHSLCSNTQLVFSNTTLVHSFAHEGKDQHFALSGTY